MEAKDALKVSGEFINKEVDKIEKADKKLSRVINKIEKAARKGKFSTSVAYLKGLTSVVVQMHLEDKGYKVTYSCDGVFHNLHIFWDKANAVEGDSI